MNTLKRLATYGCLVLFPLLSVTSGQAQVTLKNLSGTMTKGGQTSSIDSVLYAFTQGFQPFGSNGSVAYITFPKGPNFGVTMPWGSGTFQSIDQGNGVVLCKFDNGLSGTSNINGSFTYTRWMPHFKLSTKTDSLVKPVGAINEASFNFRLWMDGKIIDHDPKGSYSFLNTFGKKCVFSDSTGRRVGVDSVSWWGSIYYDTTQQCSYVPDPGTYIPRPPYLAQLSFVADSFLVVPDTAIGFHFIFKPYFLLVDQYGAPIKNTEFKIYRASNTPQTDVKLKTDTTDKAGRIIKDEHFSTGDILKFSRIERAVSSPKANHGVFGDTAYFSEVDNMQIDTNSNLSFDTVKTNPQQRIIIGHLKVRLNCLVSIQWAADDSFITTTKQDMRRLANYLYDVFDGQVDLNEVAVFDKGQYWKDADIQIYASTQQWPKGTNEGVTKGSSTGLKMPRRWAGDTLVAERHLLADPNWLTDTNLRNSEFRTIGHELGHYYFGFYDEYKDGALNLDHDAAHNLGYMDMQYAEYGPFSSELSSNERYHDDQLGPSGGTNQRNTRQSLDCWSDFKARFTLNLQPLNYTCFALRPYDRNLPSDKIYLAGPNDDNYEPGSAQYDVGSAVGFMDFASHTPGATDHYIFDAPTGHFRFGPQDLPYPHIYLYKVDKTNIDQGETDETGRINILGASRGDIVLATGGNRFDSVDYWYWAKTITNQALSKQNSPASDPVIHITPTQVKGNYAFLPTTSFLANGTLSAGITESSSFSMTPTFTVAQVADTGKVFTMTYDGSAKSYTTILPTPPAEAMCIFNAIDDAANPFPVLFNLTQVDSGLEFQSFDGKLQLTLDSSNVNAVHKFASLSTNFRSPNTGLSPGTERVGSITAIAFDPPGLALKGSNVLTMHYDYVPAKHPERSIQIYQWSGASHSWSALSGNVDVREGFKSVSTTINSDGIYGIFTSGLADVTSKNLTRIEGLTAYFDASTRSIRVNYEAAPDERASLVIYNILGESVKSLPEQSFASGPQQLFVPAQELPSGVYFCMLRSPMGIKTAKLVIEH